jgi:hypothetical protein
MAEPPLSTEEGGISAFQRAVFRVLYNRRARQQAAAVRELARPLARSAPPLREAGCSDLDAGAACRFCFDGGPKRLVSPCSCSGSQTWVHETCLVRWQKAARRTGQHEHSAVCNVCQTTYSLAPPPPPPPPTVRAGMLLVAAHGLEGSFHRSVILLCDVRHPQTEPPQP